MGRRRDKNLSLKDRFCELVKTGTKKLDKIYDRHTQNKIPIEVEIIGKPNLLLS